MKYFFIFSFWYLTDELNNEFASNKPTYYQLEYGDHNIPETKCFIPLKEKYLISNSNFIIYLSLYFINQ